MPLIPALAFGLALPQLGIGPLPLTANPSSISAHRWSEGSVYQLLAAPGQLSSIMLEPGEKLISVAAGDTAQWVIGDTESGLDETRRSHILVKPVMTGLKTNLVIMTDRRVYEVALESRAEAPVTSLRWTYGEPAILALKAPPEPRCGMAMDLHELNFSYRIEGDAVPWRPIRAFDDGRQTFIEFSPAIAASEAPPLFIKGASGRLELVNYRMKGRYYVVDRLFGEGELRLGEKRQHKVSIVRLANSGAVPARRSS